MKKKAVPVLVSAQGESLLMHKEGERSVAWQVATALFWTVMGLLTPRVTVYGTLSPFGVGLAASVGGGGALLTCVAVAVGYLLSKNTLFLLRYLAAVTIAAGIRWSFGGIRGKGERWLPALAGGVASLTAGLAVQVASGISLYTVLPLICESVLAGGFARMCTVLDRLLREGADEDGFTAAEQSSAVAVAAVAIMALNGVALGGISLGRILSSVAILLFARSGKEQGGGIAGTVLGAALWLTDPTAYAAAVAMAFAGLVAGIFAKVNRFAAAGAYLIAGTLTVMAGGVGETMALTAYESAIAGILFVLLPTSLDRRINGFFLRGRTLPAVEGLRRSVVWRLDYAARAMEEVAGTVDEVSRRMAAVGAPDLGSLCREASEKVCRGCTAHTRCWDAGYHDTMDAFNRATDRLREGGKLTKEDLTGTLADCAKSKDILEQINSGYGRYLMRESAFRRLSEIRAVAGDQFFAMSSMLTELATSFSDPATVDEATAAKVREVCDGFDMPVQEVLCTTGHGRMTVDIIAEDGERRFDELPWREQMNNVCGREFQAPEITHMGALQRVILRECPRFAISVGQAQLCCSGERLCGDATEFFTDPDGRTVLVLSDGMGCGGRAAVDGAMASGLTARLLQAGFGADSVLRMVNAALMVKGGDETLATLDVAVIDPFSGHIDSLKAGATVSLLRSGGRVSRIEQSSLPLGILRDVSFARTGDTLAAGDILLMFSDGAVSESIEAAEEILKSYDESYGSMQNLAESVAAAARRLQQASGDREDDITVVAARMYV